MLLALGTRNRRLPLAVSLEDKCPTIAFRGHLLFHRNPNIFRRIDVSQLDAGDFHSPLVSGIVENATELVVDGISRCQCMIQ